MGCLSTLASRFENPFGFTPLHLLVDGAGPQQMKIADMIEQLLAYNVVQIQSFEEETATVIVFAFLESSRSGKLFVCDYPGPQPSVPRPQVSNQ